MKIEKEFKVFGNIEDLMSLLEANSFNISHYVMHSNMHFTYNGKTVKLRIEYDINKEGFGVKFYKIIKEDINSKDLIKPKAETSTRLTPEEFITEFNKFSKKVKGKNIVFYTLLKNRLKSSLKSYKGITVDVCYFQNRPVDIAEYDLEDIITAYPDLMQFINKINKSAEKLFLAQPYIEIESLSKNMTTSKLIELAHSEIFHGNDFFISDKSAATLAKIFHGQYNALRIKSEEELTNKKSKSKKSDRKDKYASIAILQNTNIISENMDTMSKVLASQGDNEIQTFFDESSDKKNKSKKLDKKDKHKKVKVHDTDDNESAKCSEDTSLLKHLINEKYGVKNAEVFKDRGSTLPTDFDGDDLCDSKATQNIIRSPHIDNEKPIRYGKIFAIDKDLIKKFDKSDLVKTLKFAGIINQDISDDETFIIGNNLLVLGIK